MRALTSNTYTHKDIHTHTHTAGGEQSALEGQLWVEAFVLGMICLFGSWHPDEQ